VLDTRTWREFPGSLEQTGATEVLGAMADRLEDLGEWGLAQLRDFQQLWTDAAEELVELSATTLSLFIGAGASLMEKAADIAEAIQTSTGPTEELLNETLEALVDGFDALNVCPDVQNTSFSRNAIAKARAALNTWEIGSDTEAVDDAVALALATFSPCGIASPRMTRRRVWSICRIACRMKPSISSFLSTSNSSPRLWSNRARVDCALFK
jgi:hypothetical protein